MISIDKKELEKFNKPAKEWLDQEGEFKMLHKINPIRVDYLLNKIYEHFSIEVTNVKPLEKLNILDVGCGGGLISIPIAKLGANITGIDANIVNTQTANKYAKDNNLENNTKFINETAEQHLQTGNKYDVIFALEIIEHVANPKDFVHNLTKMLNPGGMIVISTINRTLKSYMLAIVMAEHVLGWVPKHTHDYEKFIKPSELNQMLNGTKFSLKELKGLKFGLPWGSWQLSMDVDINYFAYIG